MCGRSSLRRIIAGASRVRSSYLIRPQQGTRLATGREADVLVVPRDPTRDLAALHQVVDIYQGGRRVEREARQVPIEESTE